MIRKYIDIICSFLDASGLRDIEVETITEMLTL